MDKRTVLITGAAIGIGRAAALCFAANGDHVIVTDVLEDKGQAVVAEIEAAGGSAEFHALDVRSTEAADALVADLNDRFGGIDVIVANAGIALRVPMAEMTDEKWHQTIDVDLYGMLRVIRPALPAMKQGASIICLSSIMGTAYGWDEHVHYSTAKSGVVGLVRGLAVEYADKGIRVNGVAPGYIRTAQLLNPGHSLGPDAADIASPYIPMRRLGEPGEIANVIKFLASSDASYLTGQVVTVDGGLTPGRY
ncbi:3-oxoacyl-[acyl-carrier-protein] reductase FabG [Thalassovita gelatinovora]|uniref:3-oxoacyl-[acyl-carrier-protein] reductase FabG n=1 Tax=Thalassovita gelatinovora TaxID=53501 RepID=A0A0P1FHM9_THAGE|nr:SDR family NAD(P)-dependent oxidoreductase [Thalassovita gelatinovora]QIZ82023.1 SDR family oxidoreductase [Thalassovita gelatinovora]CUH67495.1 3-oxoacyl-[acyl-carrier-protein] reductase FabG [Thalassovita gelatinovora]SEP72932.1 3-oxoacyl-[acyl-carrier protein] reductase [Thalassovita gelatinovora]